MPLHRCQRDTFSLSACHCTDTNVTHSFASDPVYGFSLGKKKIISTTTKLRDMSNENPCFAFVKVNVLDEDTLVMNLEFSVQETTCLRDSGDSSTCAFQRGYSVVSDPERNARENVPTFMTMSGSGITKGTWLLPVCHLDTHWITPTFPSMGYVLWD